MRTTYSTLGFSKSAWQNPVSLFRRVVASRHLSVGICSMTLLFKLKAFACTDACRTDSVSHMSAAGAPSPHAAGLKTEAALLDSLVRIAVRSRDSSTAARRTPRHAQAMAQAAARRA